MFEAKSGLGLFLTLSGKKNYFYMWFIKSIAHIARGATLVKRVDLSTQSKKNIQELLNNAKLPQTSRVMLEK